MRITSVALVLSAVGVCAQAAPSHLPAVQDQPADINVQNLADLQLDAELQEELEGAMSRHDYASAERILVSEAERDPKSVRGAKLLSVAGGVFFLDGKYVNSAIAWKKADAIVPLDERSRFTLAMAYIKLNRRGWAGAGLEKMVGNGPEKPLYFYWLDRAHKESQDEPNRGRRLPK